METSYNISTSRNKSHIRERVRAVVTLVGIVIAIMCSVVLMKDFHVAERAEVKITESVETSKFVNADLLLKLKNMAAASTLWLLR